MAPMCKENIQGKSKRNPNYNWAKLSQIQQSPAKANQGKSLDFLVRIEPYQGLARTPQGVFSFASPVRPHRLARVGPPLRPGAFLVSMSASFNCARSAALLFLEDTMTQIRRICKENVEKSPKRPEFRAFGDAAAHPRLRHPTAAPAGPRPPADNSGRGRQHHCTEVWTVEATGLFRPLAAFKIALRTGGKLKKVFLDRRGSVALGAVTPIRVRKTLKGTSTCRPNI